MWKSRKCGNWFAIERQSHRRCDTIGQFFLKHFEKEAPATRKLTSSRNAREIAWLIVREEAALVDGLEKGAFDWVEIACPSNIAAVLAEYDNVHDSLTRRLKAIPASRWDEKLPFMMGGQEVMRENGYDMAWGFLLDQIHHRGQLSTYLRPMGSTVPAIYGPSADEQV